MPVKTLSQQVFLVIEGHHKVKIDQHARKQHYVQSLLWVDRKKKVVNIVRGRMANT